MNRKTLSIVTLAWAALASGNVMAQNASGEALAKTQQAHPSSFSAKLVSPLSREAVQADLRQAQRTGDIVANGETGAKLNELFPASYAATAAKQYVSRDAVKAELREAQRTGDLVANGETGIPANEMFPGQYPAQVAEQGISREEVRADLREALRTGDIVANGETGMKLNEVFRGRYASNS